MPVGRSSVGVEFQKILTETLTVAEAAIKASDNTLAETLTFAEAEWFAINHFIPETLTIGDDFYKGTSVIKDESVTFSIDVITLLSREISQTLDFSMTVGESIVSFAIGKTISESLTIDDAFFFGETTHLAESFSFTEAFYNQAGKVTPYDLAFSFSRWVDAGHVDSDSVSFAESPIKDVTKPLAETLTLDFNYFKVSEVYRTFSESLSFAEDVFKSFTNIKDWSFAITESPVISKTIIRTLTESLAFAMTVSSVRAIVLSFSVDFGFTFWRTRNLANKIVNEFNNLLSDDIRDTFKVPVGDDIKKDEDLK